MFDSLKHGRDAYRRRAWADAYRSLSLADQWCPLGAEDLQLLGTSAYLTGRDLDFQRIFERTHHAHVAADDHVRAARCGFWLGLTFLLGGEIGPGSGWLSRARRLVESRNCVEQGYLLLPVAEQCLAEGNGETAHGVASTAASIGNRFGDADLMACARHLEGRALVQQAQIKAGLAILDEAMLAVIAGELSPIMTGLMYCSVIEACQQVYAWSRAREWTSAFSRWCEQQPEMVAFTGACLVRRAEILQFRGAWPDAMTEAHRACERSQEANREPPGAAFYQQAEIHRPAAGLTNIKVETIIETTEFASGNALWDWIVSSNPIVDCVLSPLKLTNGETRRQARAGDHGPRLGLWRRAARLTNPIHIGVGMK